MYRKTALIEARQFDPTTDLAEALRVLEWCGAVDGPQGIMIPTLEDGPNGQVPHYIQEGDWIAKGGAGEFWAINPDRFADTYELAEEPAHP
jgi:hypothetical protein